MSLPLETLKKYWGFESFRPLQEDIVNWSMEGKDSLVLLPTGGGKSLCFQIPALCLPGLTIVISPLIALMKDQVDNLKKRSISAEAIYSGMRYKDIDRILDNAAHGAYKLLYLSPERLKSDLFQGRLPRMNLSLIAVDEAHCISQWGYDFRPAYLDINLLREHNQEVPIIALTASATPDVVKDIQVRLELGTDKIFQQSFARDNLSYVVVKQEGKVEKVAEILTKVSGSAIVYCSRRGTTQEIANFLNRRSIRCAAYHAGMPPQQRMEIQQNWLRGDTRVIAATNAFGMGIDKPDVRAVIHLSPPGSLEAYYQEAGRAGRDGKKSFAVLLYDTQDKKTLRLLLDQQFPSLKIIRQVYQGLCNAYQLAVGSNNREAYTFELIQFCKTYKFAPGPTHFALRILQNEGWIHISDAVFQPSRLWVKVSKDRLYDFQLKTRNLEPLIKTILRTYQGAFQQLVNINESQLAKFLKINSEQLRKAFIFMQREGIIDYHPQKDKPQVSFLLERVGVENLTIDTNRHAFLKERAAKNLAAIFRYAEDPICRSQQILNYFGEVSNEKCGYCDVCVDRDRVTLDDMEFYTFKQAIERLLKKDKAITFENLVKHFSNNDLKKVIRVLSDLREEGVVKFEDEKFVLTTNG